MKIFRLAHVLSGALAAAAIGLASTTANGPVLIERLEQKAEAARDAEGGQGIGISFRTHGGSLTRHPYLSGGEGLDNTVRSRVASAIADVPGVGGVRWTSRGQPSRKEARAAGEAASLHCQEDVEAILAVRMIRFPESSPRIDRASQTLLDEVATALMPCVGSIIAITGHTDSNGDKDANLALSKARAEAVRWALIGRGIPADGLRATGVGSEQPLEGLDPEDAANRRIDFSVIETTPLQPTPIDTPGPG